MDFSYADIHRLHYYYLDEMHQCRILPFYSHQDIFPVNTAHLVTEQDVFIEDRKCKQDNLEHIEVQTHHLVLEMRKTEEKQDTRDQH